jgi:hypothetical protein
LAEPFDSHVASAEESGSLRVIARAATNIVAFVGRTLKGPVNDPVLLRSFADFTRVFGGLWQPSTLSYAVEQFFENGGRAAVIVRVVNGARPPSLTLPTANGKLILLRWTTTPSTPRTRTASTWWCSEFARRARRPSKTRKSSGG